MSLLIMRGVALLVFGLLRQLFAGEYSRGRQAESAGQQVSRQQGCEAEEAEEAGDAQALCALSEFGRSVIYIKEYLTSKTIANV